ncbi:TetR/AcrR family transcriptional regulator [Streptomyces ipomoeae]|uniref:TetR/AcrR family transcriptional regulator n=1 Tax=Streptomyces ipomoeae TaxID=103232 RepID=UPI0015F0D63A|nr:TetR/AcrR family transcriptional regulator [Streptomyces ipomoeae]MDX2939389.1 TetR/AcrR family transcriptional regulator [Streptomyces ipomoeae]
MKKSEPGHVRERLLETADRLFYAEGIHAVGIDRVIAESRVAKSTMYVHFRTKEDLVAQYLRRRSDVTRARVTQEVEARAHESAEDRILSVFDVLHQVISEPGFRGCAFANAAAEYPHHDGIQSAIAYDRAWLPALFARLLESRHAGGGELVAALVQLYDGANASALLDSSRTSAQTARRTAELLLADRRPAFRDQLPSPSHDEPAQNEHGVSPKELSTVTRTGRTDA